MTENEIIGFFGDEAIKRHVEELWASVIDASSKVIQDAKVFGFEKIGIVPNPNIHQMLASLAVLDGMLELILNSSQTAKIDANETRLIFNARQQILNMEQIATALNNDDRESYNEAVNRLERQAPF